jgi:hypothetical protein
MATRDFRKLALLCGEASEGEETNKEIQRRRYVYERQGFRKEKGRIEVGPQSNWVGTNMWRRCSITRNGYNTSQLSDLGIGRA